MGQSFFSNGSQVPCTDSQANEIPSPSCSTAFAHQITCPRVASVVVASVGIARGSSAPLGPSHHWVLHTFQSKAFLARLLPFFLATPAAFFRRLRVTAFLMDSTRLLGVSRGPVPGSSKKRQLLCQLLGAHLGRELEFLFGTWGDVGFGRYGWFSGSSRRGPLFYTLGRLDQLREQRLHGPSSKWSLIQS